LALRKRERNGVLCKRVLAFHRHSKQTAEAVGNYRKEVKIVRGS
jgi:hypothetical protein